MWRGEAVPGMPLSRRPPTGAVRADSRRTRRRIRVSAGGAASGLADNATLGEMRRGRIYPYPKSWVTQYAVAGDREVGTPVFVEIPGGLAHRILATGTGPRQTGAAIASTGRHENACSADATGLRAARRDRIGLGVREVRKQVVALNPFLVGRLVQHHLGG